MTVAEVVRLLAEFPPELPVFFTPDTAGRRAFAPLGAVRDLVHPTRGEVLNEDDRYATVPMGFTHALVIQPCVVREPIAVG
ncbi:MAG TPA: hypothetical protein VKD90_10120 [Gemmataceae bacterium]|nr:hypothetical protein [Gemmataceae bacterium]